MMLVKAPMILVPAEFSKWPCISTPYITWGRTVNSPATEPIWLKTQSCVTEDWNHCNPGTLWPSLGPRVTMKRKLVQKKIGWRISIRCPLTCWRISSLLKIFQPPPRMFRILLCQLHPEVPTVAENLWVRPEAWKAMAGLVLCSWCVENAECRLGSRSWSKHTNKHNELRK